MPKLVTSRRIICFQMVRNELFVYFYVCFFHGLGRFVFWSICWMVRPFILLFHVFCCQGALTACFQLMLPATCPTPESRSGTHKRSSILHQSIQRFLAVQLMCGSLCCWPPWLAKLFPSQPLANLRLFCCSGIPQATLPTTKRSSNAGAKRDVGAKSWDRHLMATAALWLQQSKKTNHMK